MIERTLVLEITFIDRAFEDCRAQPLIQRRAEHLGQVLGGVTTITLDQADAQVHVVFAGFIEQQANQEVASDLALFAQHLEIRCNQGEAFLVQAPGQTRVGLLVVPGFFEDRVQVQHEGIGIQAQFALTEVAADAAADIPGGRGTVVGVEANPLQVGGKAQALVTGRFGPDVQAHIAQGAGDLEAIDHGHEFFRQRRQCIDQRGNRRQIEAVGLDLPGFFARFGGGRLLELQVRLPTGLAQAHGQRVDQYVNALFASLEPGIEGQVVDLHRLAFGIVTAQLRRIEANHRALQLALAPVHPELAARTQFGSLPLAQQARRQPARPVALGQAEVGIDFTIAPLAGANAAAQAQRQRLAIGQGHPRVQALTHAARLQAEADVGEGHGVALERLQGHLAVDHRDFGHNLYLLEQLFGVQRLVVFFRQPFQGPGAAFIFAQAQMQAADFKVSQAHLALNQTGPEVRHQLDAIQAQGTRPFADLDVAYPHYRRQAAPVPFQGADMHRHAQGLLGLVFDFGPVLGHQRDELPAKTDIQRHQNRQQGTDAQPPAGQGAENAHQSFHASGPPVRALTMAASRRFASPDSAHWCSDRVRAAPHRIVPGNTWTRPGSEWFGR
ncbi:hypothetical protein D3C79_636960 [compost metagenome]